MQLKLAATAERESMPESDFVAMTTARDWFVVFINDPSPKQLKPEALKLLSKLTEVVACQVEEHVMCSTAAYWENGAENCSLLMTPKMDSTVLTSWVTHQLRCLQSERGS